jgi:hypothetical protein
VWDCNNNPPPPPPPTTCTMSVTPTSIIQGNGQVAVVVTPINADRDISITNPAGVKTVIGTIPTGSNTLNGTISGLAPGQYTYSTRYVKNGVTRSCSDTLVITPAQCLLTADKPVVTAGSNTVTLAWSPTPSGAVSLSRNDGSQSTPVSVGAGVTTVQDIFTAVLGQTYTYNLSYPAAPSGQTGVYTCDAQVRVVGALTECNDGIDNGDPEDGLIDTQDPACHTDGNAGNGATYNPLIPSEVDKNSNLKPAISVSGPLTIGAISNIAVQSLNQGVVAVLTPSTRSVRISSASGVSGRPVPGNPGFISLYTGLGTYTPNETWRHTLNFIPRAAGTFQVCIDVDTDDVVLESNENDNTVCTSVVVQGPSATSPVVDLSIKKITDPASAWGSTAAIVPTEEVELRWTVSGPNVTSCRSIDGFFSTSAGASGGTQTVTEPPLGSNHTYTIECVNARGETAADSAVAENGTWFTPFIFKATPPKVRKGQSSQLVWDAGGRPNCSITGTNGDSAVLSGGSGTYITSPITSQTIFTATCFGMNMAEATVNLVPEFQEI